MNLNLNFRDKWKGYTAALLLLISYGFLFKGYPNIFASLNLISCILLFFHAWDLTDNPFIIVNLVAAAVLTWKLFGGGIC